MLKYNLLTCYIYTELRHCLHCLQTETGSCTTLSIGFHLSIFHSFKSFMHSSCQVILSHKSFMLDSSCQVIHSSSLSCFIHHVKSFIHTVMIQHVKSFIHQVSCFIHHVMSFIHQVFHASFIMSSRLFIKSFMLHPSFIHSVTQVIHAPIYVFIFFNSCHTEMLPAV